MAPSDIAEKNRNMGAQLHSLRSTTAAKLSGKTYVLYDFWILVRTNLFFRAIFGLPARSSTLAVGAM